ncbi:glycosyltransferase family 2 protein [Pseudoxanthomonas sp. SGD-10]|nr:glycosyltransferase family 2 protein [Pseudoxanthomonas sp. SGD-10]
MPTQVVEQAQPLLSVIVPHKNASRFLAKLLNTIPNDPRIEVIVIDDASETAEVEALRRIAFAPHWKLELLSQSGFAGHARNVGLELAKGTWIAFADADDCFTCEFPDAVYPYLHREDIDIVYFDVASVDTTGRPSYRHIPYSQLVADYLSGRKPEAYIRHMHTPPWGKIIRREFLLSRNIRFKEIPASNDIEFSVISGNLARAIEVSAHVIYSITQRSGSITSTISTENLLSKFYAALRVNKFLRESRNSKFQHSILYFMYRAWTFDRLLALKMLMRSIAEGNNPLIGASKIVNYREVIRKRESR